MLEVTQEVLQEIRRHGRLDYPYECCGLLLGGFTAAGGKFTREAYPISNAREEEVKRNRFLITPEEYRRGQKHAQSVGLDIVGFYHSHPDHPAAPSGFDLEHAWPVYSYVIVSVREGTPEALRSWQLKDDRGTFEEEPIRLLTGTQEEQTVNADSLFDRAMAVLAL